MEFHIILEPATLAAITKRLTPLAETVTYQPGKLSIDKFDPANETRIVDEITDCLPTVRDLPDYGDLTRRATKAQRLARQGMKRKRQATVAA